MGRDWDLSEALAPRDHRGRELPAARSVTGYVVLGIQLSLHDLQISPFYSRHVGLPRPSLDPSQGPPQLPFLERFCGLHLPEVALAVTPPEHAVRPRPQREGMGRGVEIGAKAR